MAERIAKLNLQKTHMQDHLKEVEEDALEKKIVISQREYEMLLSK